MLGMGVHRIDVIPAVMFSAAFLISVIMIWSY
jgi:hypothetical protein